MKILLTRKWCFESAPAQCLESSLHLLQHVTVANKSQQKGLKCHKLRSSNVFNLLLSTKNVKQRNILNAKHK